MVFSFIPLASGSSGNSTVIETDKTKVLVDCGISFSKLVSKLKEVNIDIKDISRLYITHAHADHTAGLISLLKKTSIPVYTRKDTATVLKQKYKNDLSILEKLILIQKKFSIVDDLKISYFKLPHDGWNFSNTQDAGDHIGFIFEYGLYRLSYMTDCGHLTTGVMELNKSSDAYFIESNYDDELQMKSSRPWGLKQRVMSDKGHLSNEQAGDYLLELTDVNKTRHIFLAHLSSQCNTKELAISTVSSKLKQKFSNLNDISVMTELLRRYHIA
ncbi:MAG: hypothetical protein A2Y40_07400 [Candidatus Margulisbacteria bacterium GWF2_35_9]|nr:MAG: hypothetical protein A2Y40_07400 [Candidatus Margulisbacteria bacterium GWF2_35_9]